MCFFWKKTILFSEEEVEVEVEEVEDEEEEEEEEEVDPTGLFECLEALPWL